MIDPKSTAVTYVGPHESVEVPVDDALYVFERNVPVDVPADAAELLLGGSPDLFNAGKASTKEK